MTDTLSQPPQSARKPLPPSPCVGVCTMDGRYCYGCGRTADEIATWGGASDADKSEIWAALPARLISMAVRTFRLAPDPAGVARFISRTFTEGAGNWQVDGPSLLAKFEIDPGSRPGLKDAEKSITATGASGQIRFTKNDRVRVFGLARAPDADTMDTVALVLPKGRARRNNPERIEVNADDATLDLALPDSYLSARLNGAANGDIQSLSGKTWPEARAEVAELIRRKEAQVTVSSVLCDMNANELLFTANNNRAPDSNAPADIKIASAFAACALFSADDPDWLRHALAP